MEMDTAYTPPVISLLKLYLLLVNAPALEEDYIGTGKSTAAATVFSG